MSDWLNKPRPWWFHLLLALFLLWLGWWLRGLR